MQVRLFMCDQLIDPPWCPSQTLGMTLRNRPMVTLHTFMSQRPIMCGTLYIILAGCPMVIMQSGSVIFEQRPGMFVWQPHVTSPDNQALYARATGTTLLLHVIVDIDELTKLMDKIVI